MHRYQICFDVAKYVHRRTSIVSFANYCPSAAETVSCSKLLLTVLQNRITNKEVESEHLGLNNSGLLFYFYYRYGNYWIPPKHRGELN